MYKDYLFKSNKGYLSLTLVTLPVCSSLHCYFLWTTLSRLSSLPIDVPRSVCSVASLDLDLVIINLLSILRD
ncbi:hypothetical protein DDB_G0284989 [Dictyostelium discoideum AX4]|uniref:Uncharacterized transmembrane protein DDB_G0284989 n=1 Tax=Dictyostelium discoideum TaxID=44689 RepID=Y6304_DICDI|nr:hypothetical protein DDB_G0284989 [Dictyostelium discoideum AX4]Q54NT8.1 RecName: Full=Uncharacterized transmembrane protein DDB_G0284989 [Dictyostelium discoideum]EAL64958.1 hypothetical protein DDB_G0284989 [Dictyostelium discoideum AX4]|eukprot:XP_639979.1 hypothetical protein DDB_G0284989 [Dictyostelium discoideum AX4]